MSIYLLLMRHGSVDRGSADLECNQKLSTDGVKDATAVAKALGENLSFTDDGAKIRIAEVIYSPYRHANETAGVLYSAFRSRGELLSCRPCDELAPNVFWPDTRVPSFANSADALACELQSTDNGGTGANAIVVVGHEPQLSWIAEGLLSLRVARTVLPRKLPPPARAEVHCLRLEPNSWTRPRHLWSISPSDEKTVAALVDKIKSKMQTAGQLGAFLTFLLGAALGLLADRDKLGAIISNTTKEGAPRLLTASLLPQAFAPPLPPNVLYIVLAISIGSLFCAMGLYLAAMFAYDSLLMPSRFWLASRRIPPVKWMPQRPPSPAAWTLYANMTHIWRWLFTPATWAVVLGLLGLAEVVFFVHPLDFMALVVAVGMLFGLYVYWKRPRFGAQD